MHIPIKAAARCKRDKARPPDGPAWFMLVFMFIVFAGAQNVGGLYVEKARGSSKHAGMCMSWESSSIVSFRWKEKG